jgi:hypothetical protein
MEWMIRLHNLEGNAWYLYCCGYLPYSLGWWLGLDEMRGMKNEECDYVTINRKWGDTNRIHYVVELRQPMVHIFDNDNII